MILIFYPTSRHTGKCPQYLSPLRQENFPEKTREERIEYSSPITMVPYFHKLGYFRSQELKSYDSVYWKSNRVFPELKRRV